MERVCSAFVSAHVQVAPLVFKTGETQINIACRKQTLDDSELAGKS